MVCRASEVVLDPKATGGCLLSSYTNFTLMAPDSMKINLLKISAAH